jgi:hypothetical protein
LLVILRILQSSLMARPFSAAIVSNPLGPRRYRPVRRAAAGLALLGGLAITLPEFLGIGAAGLGPFQWAGLSLVFSTLLVAIGLGRIDGRRLLLGCSLGIAAALIAFGLGWHGSDLSGLLWSAREKVAGPQRLGIYQMDPRLGWRHEPDSSTVHEHLDFKAHYTIDAAGNRVLPQVAEPRGRIVLMGCSFTFGHGVDDNQTYAAQLASGPWRDWQLENLAVSGWGTSQAYLRLEQRLQQPPLPDLVLYGWLATHAQRNERRRSWLELLDLFGRRNPLVTWPPDQPPQSKLIGPRDGVDDSPSLRAAEQEQSVRLLVAIDQLCRQHGVRFACVLLANQSTTEDGVTDPLVARLKEQNVMVIDARRVQGSYFLHDGHPQADWHAAMARFLAADPMIQSALSPNR